VESRRAFVGTVLEHVQQGNPGLYLYMYEKLHFCTCICINIYTLVSRRDAPVPMSTRSDVKNYLKIKQAPC
jgi:hypothetical protein